MKWLNLAWVLLKDPTFSAYGQFAIATIILIGLTVFYQFSEGKLISSGIYLSFAWMPASMIISLFMEPYWVYLLHWLLASIGFFGAYFLMIYLCGKYGNPYTGDGGMVMILPIYLIPVVFAGSLILKGGIWMIALL